MDSHPTEPVRARGRPKDPELKARRKAEILDAAAHLFAEVGFANAQVQELANRIGVGNGTIYRYFPTKQDLFLKAVEQGLQELSADVDAAIALRKDDPIQQITGAVRAYLWFFHRRPEMAELFVQERAAFPKQHRPLYFTIKDGDPKKECERAEIFQRLLDSGKARPMPVERFFGVIGDLLYGTILTNLLTGRPADPDVQASDVLDMIFNGILTETGRTS